VRGSPKLLGIRSGALLTFYVWRLRRNWLLELLAGSGIAAGTALIFGVLVANASLTGPTSEILRALKGPARLQLVARSSDGFSYRLATEAGRLSGVERAVPLLSENVAIVGPKGKRSVDLIGVTPALIGLDGHRFMGAGATEALLSEQLGLAPGVAAAVGADRGRTVRMLANGLSYSGSSFPLTLKNAPTLASSRVAVASLVLAQRLTGTQGRVTQVLVEPRPGADRLVEDELRRLAAERVDVEPANSELRRLDATTAPSNRSTILFAAVGASVGLLLTLNAMLLIAPERRRLIAELRLHGFEARQIVALLGFQALALGLVASGVGIACGYALSRTLFSESPAYLAFAFPVGTRQVVHVSAVLFVLGCGLLTTLLASLPAFMDLRSQWPTVAVAHGGDGGAELEGAVARRLGQAGVTLVAAAIGVLLLYPRAAAIGDVALASATLCLIPVTFAAVIRYLARVGERARNSMLALAVAELRATPLHAVGLAGVAAVALYGSNTIRGAQHDLTRGLSKANAEFFASADIWVTSGASEFITTSFEAGRATEAIAATPGVAAVREYQGGLIDVGPRRMWLRARPTADATIVEPGQILEGGVGRASSLIRHGGWVAISGGLASERDLRVGSHLLLPTPSGPVRFGVAAVTTNFGWFPGVITLSSADYRRYWQTSLPTALEVDLKRGVPLGRGMRAVEQTLAARHGLQVRSAGELDANFDRNVQAGLRSLGDISMLLLIASALAIASALSATIWRRRPRFAALKIQGFDRLQIWRALMLESAIVLSVGCGLGSLLGILGHALANNWLELSTGFPAPFALDEPQILLALLVVALIALGVVALPGVGAARVSPRLGFEE
jgi:putative ABC transport system permease protein